MEGGRGSKGEEKGKQLEKRIRLILLVLLLGQEGQLSTCDSQALSPHYPWMGLREERDPTIQIL
jgi:hypothetical protein